MGANFRIDVTKQNRNTLFKLQGDLNSSSAYEVLRRMENYKGSSLIILDFSRIRKCHPFGMDILKKGYKKGGYYNRFQELGISQKISKGGRG